MLLAFLSFFAGLILDSVARACRETKWLRYLEHPAPADAYLAADHRVRVAVVVLLVCFYEGFWGW